MYNVNMNFVYEGSQHLWNVTIKMKLKNGQQLFCAFLHNNERFKYQNEFFETEFMSLIDWKTKYTKLADSSNNCLLKFIV